MIYQCRRDRGAGGTMPPLNLRQRDFSFKSVSTCTAAVHNSQKPISRAVFFIAYYHTLLHVVCRADNTINSHLSQIITYTTVSINVIRFSLSAYEQLSIK